MTLEWASSNSSTTSVSQQTLAGKHGNDKAGHYSRVSGCFGFNPGIAFTSINVKYVSEIKADLGKLKTKLVCALLSLAIVAVIPLVSANSTGATQIVFSNNTTGTGDWAAPGSDPHFGFWYWCQATSSNPYGPDCSGSIYIYGIQFATVATVCISTASLKCVTNNGGGSFTLIALGLNGWKCTLTNTPPVTSGPSNTVTMTCAPPFEFGSTTVPGTGTAPGSVVEIH